jgi:methionyl-tRNA formyltransferase
MSTEAISVVYFGTPDYAVPTLEALAADDRFDIRLVVTQPDRPAGRGRTTREPAVKSAARRLGIETYQPETLRTAAARGPLVDVDADLFVVAAYGLIFGRSTLSLPSLGCLNLHASLLPRFRGASPVAAAILCGDTSTGVSLMLMEAGLDTGPVVARVDTSIGPSETTESLTSRLAILGAELAIEAIPRYAKGELAGRAQDASAATVTRPLKKMDGWLDWREPASALDRRVRAMRPWPRAWTTVDNETLQIHQAEAVEQGARLAPGTLTIRSGEAFVVCGEGALRLDVVQRSGRSPMGGRDWIAGRHVLAGQRLGDDLRTEIPPLVRPAAD